MRFFVLARPEVEQASAEADVFTSSLTAVGDAPRCPVCGRLIGMLRLVPPVRVELRAWGRELGDILFMTGDERLVSERPLGQFRAGGLTGLEDLRPVEIVKLRPRGRVAAPPRYVCCRVARGRAVVDDVASGLVRERRRDCAEYRFGGTIKGARRVILEPGSWSGEDVFKARGLPGTVLVSERFKALCNQERATNCVLIPAEEYTFGGLPAG